MENEKVKQIYQNLTKEAEVLKDPTEYNQNFIDWRSKALRMTVAIFGKQSSQERSLEQARFVRPSAYSRGPFSAASVNQYETTVDRFQKLLHSFVEEHTLFGEGKSDTSDPKSQGGKKIFISHSSKDDEIGKEVINLLQLIGVKHNQIFYTSATGYGIPLGKDWVETLKTEVSAEGIVISLLSDNYFTSQICLLEMGATWVLSKLHIPILIPPLNFKSVNEVINATQGFMITDKLKWSTLKKDLEQLFDIDPLPYEKWEPQRDAILDRISKLLPS
ncbi:toll/interleukin-1 receptor domain-containing protein [Algoriphagus sp. AGSA1]|uniref:toll/interleukin-1 receptor domain-containing protein n=1 Tax=Algoriphagus sp. AGSA1 TaxID=2907213 RepID=UPI001F1CA840|nr:toll/interleukin-1 receptor domain-containing protein [Algoriphagus sp. AGSA1]MCE7058122.1 toll/interleukin-1 receptor domain-containing protein [Algoriphagus sp. AGSA1]